LFITPQAQARSSLSEAFLMPCGLDQITPLNQNELSIWLSKYQYFQKVFVLPLKNGQKVWEV